MRKKIEGWDGYKRRSGSYKQEKSSVVGKSARVQGLVLLLPHLIYLHKKYQLTDKKHIVMIDNYDLD